MAVSKATVQPLDDSGNASGTALTCMYNPQILAYGRAPKYGRKEIPGMELSELHRQGGGMVQLTVKFLFDTTRAMTTTDDGVAVTQGADVRTYTKFFADQLKETTSGKQTYVQFAWGGKIYIVKGWVIKFDAHYQLFKSDGTPIRSEVTVTFEEQATLTQLDQLWQNPTSRSLPRRTWIVRQGDRLDYIAFKEYHDASMWRHIAEENGISDPFNLVPGQILKLTPRS